MSTFAFLTFFLIVVGIPVIGGFVSKMHKANIELEKKKLETLGHQTAEKAAQYAAHTQRLEQRVRVLERIITDKGFDVSMQIEELRSEPETKELNWCALDMDSPSKQNGGKIRPSSERRGRRHRPDARGTQISEGAGGGSGADHHRRPQHQAAGK